MAKRSNDGTEAIINVVGKENLTQMAADVEKAVDKAAISTAKLPASFDAAGKSVLTTKERVALLATGIDSMLNLFGKAAAAAKVLREHVENAAKSLAIESQFERVAAHLGGAATAMERLTAASAGGIDGTTLQKFAVAADAVGMSLDQLVALLEGANRAAQATGSSQRELSEAFVKGISEMSDGVFKSLRLQVDFGQAVGQAARELGVSADALDLNHKRAVAVNRVLPELARVYGDVKLNDTTTDLARFDAELANFTDTMERFLLTSAKWTVGKGLWLVEPIASVADALRETGTQADFARAAGGAVGDVFKNLVGPAKGVTDGLTEQQKAMERQRQIWRDLLTQGQESVKSQYQNALGMARLAAEMGLAAQATDKYREALELADKAGVGYIERERLKAEAIARTNRERAESMRAMADVLFVEAELAKTEAERNELLRQAYEIQDQYNAYRAGLDVRVSDPSVPSKQNVAGGPSRPDDAAKYGLDTDRAGMAALRALLREQAAAAREQDAAAAEYGRDTNRAGLDALRELQADQVVEALGRQAEAARVLADAFASVAAPADALAQSLRALGQVSFADGLGSALPLLGAFAGAIQAAGDTQGKTAKDIAAGNAAIATSTSALVASFISDMAVKYGVLGAGEIAASLASYPDFVGMGVHGAAAVAYFAAAGIAGAAKTGAGARVGSGAGGVPAQAVTPPPSMRDRLAGSPITINMAGATILGARPAEAARDLVDMIEREQGRRSRAPSMGGMR